MTGKERIHKILKGEKVDRIGLAETFWKETIPVWENQGYPKGEEFWSHFGHDLISTWAYVPICRPGVEELIEETDEWRLTKNGDGATLKWFKERTGVPEHVGFDVTNGEVWREQYREDCLRFSKDRLVTEQYEKMLAAAKKDDLFFAFGTMEVFEVGKNIAGHEHMCMGMLDDPDWINDMFDCIVTQQIEACEYLFEHNGLPDGVWLYGDIGFKGSPFIGLDMYREMVLPHNKRLIDWFKSKGLPVIFHSCGFIEPLMPGILETGIDMLQAMEVKAGMDIRRLQPLYGDRIGFMGNIDVRTLESNDLQKVEEEIRAKVECGKKAKGYIFHMDHSIPQSVNYETYRFALDCARKYGTYN
jgi:uroporphyrinogen decarboxylase